MAAMEQTVYMTQSMRARHCAAPHLGLCAQADDMGLAVAYDKHTSARYRSCMLFLLPVTKCRNHTPTCRGKPNLLTEPPVDNAAMLPSPICTASATTWVDDQADAGEQPSRHKRLLLRHPRRTLLQQV